MKIKTQFINSMVIFGIILLIIAISVIVTNQQVERLNTQEEIAKNIERDASELGYLSNDYLIYHESPQRARWESKFSRLSDDLSNLNPNSPEQQVLVNDIRENQQRLKAVFTDVVSTFENTSQGTDPALFQISWSRMAVQNQGMAFDAARLSQMLHDQADQVKQTNIILIFTLLGLFGAYFLTNYLIVYRRALKSILDLQAGTRIIGSGNLDYFIETDQQDEIGELSRAFNQMTADLKGVTASKAELEKEITERKRAEEAMRESEQRWATTLASIGDAVIATDVEGRITFMNAVSEALTGWKLADALTKPVTEVFNIINEYTRREADNPVTRVLREGTVVGLANHTILVRKNGTEVPIDDSGAPIKDRDGKTTGVVLVFRDITERKQAEEALKESEERLRFALETSHIGAWDLDLVDHTAHRSPGHDHIFGYEQLLPQWTYEMFLDHVLPEDRATVDAKFREATATCSDWSFECRIRRVDGEVRWIWAAGRHQEDDTGRARRMAGIVQDITGRKRTEEALARSSRRVSEIMESITDGFMAIDNSWRFTYANQRAAGNLGLNPEDLIGHNIWEKFPAIKGTDHEIYYHKAMQQHEPQYFEICGVLTDKWYEIRVYPSAEGISVFWQDITERKHAEDGLRQSNQRLDILSYTAGKLLTSDKPQQVVEELCQKMLSTLDCHAFFNYLVDEDKQCLHLNACAGIPEETAREIEWLDYGVAVCGCAARDGSRIVCKNIPDTPDPRTGLVRSFGIKACACHPLFSHGNVIGTLSFGTRSRLSFTDDELTLMKTVSEHVAIAMERERAHSELERQVKERTAELEESNKALRSEIEDRKRAEDAVKAERQRLNDILDMLPAYLVLLSPDYHVPFANRFFKERFGESREFRCFEYLFSRSEPCEICETYSVLKTMAPHHWEWTGPDGRNYDIFDFTFTDTDGSILIMEVGIDITERKRAEEKIQEQAALLDKAHDAIAVRDLEHRLIYWNKGAQRLYGWTAEESTGKNVDELLYNKESSNLIEAKRNVIEKGEWMGELRQRTKDSKDIIVESHWTLVHDNNGKPKSILFINTDITEKKRLESQLLRAQRMESIGTLAGGIAHDLNNMLTPIMLSLQMLKEKFKDESSQKLLTILENNSQRGAGLIKQVLSFARGVEGERKSLEITHIISEIEKIAKNTFPRNIEIQTDMKKDLYTISGDATQLHQVIMNLCVNARDAMPDGGILSITASNIFIDENYVQMHAEAKIGSYVAIAVSDTGIGIPSKVLDRIFEPFFTTKEFGKGTGLGLPTALAIVKSHGGFINVYSEVGAGTTFGVYLPGIKTEMQNVEEQRLELPVGHGELVLVAEDEDSVREVTISTLEKYGYSVLAASDGAQAVADYAQNKDKIKVVLMDMMMPVMDGHASIRAICKINPKVKIIAVSGLAEKDRLKDVVENTDAFLPKPYTAERLLRTIHEVISAK